MQFVIYKNLVRFQIGIATVVDVASFVPVECCVNDVIVIQSKKVAVTHSEFFVHFLTFVADWMTDFLSNIFNYNVLGLKPKRVKME